ncbi:MAG: penicillin-binding protein 1C [Burkholderiales bacterium]|nr:penicillin-binding protein 1C [Burkholderiales bacterium]
MRCWWSSPEAGKRPGPARPGPVQWLLGLAPTAGLAIALLAGACGAVDAQAALPSHAQVKAAWRSSDTVLLDRQGVAIQTLRTDLQRRRGNWVALADVSPALRHALLLSEDQRFYEHSGVDWAAVSAAAWANLWNTRTRGASTVTMQLAGLLDQQLAAPRGGRSIVTKLGQARAALQLEQGWSKDQILEAYLNLVSFRGELVGIAAMSQVLFGKYPSGLDAQESALAAALIRSPAASPARVAQRACTLLRTQARAVPCDTLAAYVRQVLATRNNEPLDRDTQLAPHLARRLITQATAPAPATLRSTLDASLQRLARDTLVQQLRELRGRHVEDGAVIVIDNHSGEVLAWVGSSGDLSQAAQVDGVTAARQAGSTLKPFLYEQAIAERWFTAASLIDDRPVGLITAAGLYIPQNYDHHFKGLVSLRTALGSSLNVPAVRTLVIVSPERFAQRLDRLGLGLKHTGGYYGYSLALGSAEVNLAALANAYRTLANGGRTSPLRLQPGDPAPPPRQVLDEGASYIVADILADREARVPTFGLDNALAARYWAAVKTGTSKDMRDNWCIGFSRRYTVGVWVGNASGEAMWSVSGVSGAAPIWRTLMDALQRRDAGRPASPAWPSQAAAPAGLVQRRVAYASASEPPRDEWFIAGTEQTVITSVVGAAGSRTHITSPADRLVLALDPDIPPGAQQLSLATSAAAAPPGWSWRMDGKRLGPARAMTWPMWPGRHRLELLDAAGKVVDVVGFEVRGAQLAARSPRLGQVRPPPAP